MEGLINNTKIEELLANPAGGISDDIEGYSKKECRYIIEVMRKFELSVKAFNNEGYEFIPALLPLVEPKGIRPDIYKQCIKYMLKYDYLPDSLLKRLMVRCFNNRIVHECWGNGFTVRNDITSQTAVIYTDYQNDELRIEVYSGGRIPSNEMLSYLLEVVNDLNALLSLHAVHYIDIDIEGESPVNVDYLLRLKTRGHAIYPGMYNDFQIDLLLGLVFGDSLVIENDLVINNSYPESLEEELHSRKLTIFNYQNCIINNGNVINTEQSV